MINDFITGYLGAAGALAALIRRAREGGSYHVKVNLASTAMWYSSLGLFNRDELDFSGEEHKLLPPDSQLRVIRRIGEHIFTLEHADHGQVTDFLMRDTILPDQRIRHMGRREDAAEGLFALKLGRRTDTWQHGCGHVAQEQYHIFVFVG